MTADLSSIGGAATKALADVGGNGDQAAGDGIYSATATVAAGTKSFPVSFTDGTNTGGTFVALVVTPAATPDNDNCSTATALAGPFPIVVADDFTAATVEYNPHVSFISSPTNGMVARCGRWYTLTGTGNTLPADTCSSALIGGTTIPDTVMAILCGTCDGLSVVVNNDDNPTLCSAATGIERRPKAS